jgi:hypothetical protein
MKPLSETYKELGIDFTFPIEICNSNGRLTYRESSDGYWWKCEYDDNGNKTYHENSDGYKMSTPRSQPSERLVTNYDEIAELKGQLVELRKMLSEQREVTAELRKEITELERGG